MVMKLPCADLNLAVHFGMDVLLLALPGEWGPNESTKKLLQYSQEIRSQKLSFGMSTESLPSIDQNPTYVTSYSALGSSTEGVAILLSFCGSPGPFAHAAK